MAGVVGYIEMPGATAVLYFRRILIGHGMRASLFFLTSIVSLLPALISLAKPPVVSVASLGIVTEKPAEGPAVEVDAGWMVPYAATIPGTDVEFEMVPVPGGEFLMGSPVGEAERAEDEGPQVRVKVEPFWIGKHEVKWDEYKSYMEMYDAFKTLQRLASNRVTEGPASEENAAEWKLVETHAWPGDAAEEWGVDAVTSATPLYDPSFTYGTGEEPNQPAVTMTQFAAKQYTKWLSGITGRDYRLPCETEWEYAARAGTTTAYSFGEDAGELDDYAWTDANADFHTHPVGEKKPNPWGLHDIHGNVAEWTLDEYAADAYAAVAKKLRSSGEGNGDGSIAAADAVRRATKVYPRVIRGGSWLDEAPAARSAARHKSDDEEWKLSDPNIPLSPWWYTEEPATGVGMRIVRPLVPLTKEEKERMWEADVEELELDVRDRLREGRGVLGVADEKLPAAVEAAERLDGESE